MQKRTRTGARSLAACRSLALAGGLCLAALGLASPASAQGTVQLSWNDNSSNEEIFVIYRSLAPAVPSDQVVGTVPGNVTTYTDQANLVPGTAYCYHVRAYNTFGFSAPSNLACGVARATSPLPTITLSAEPAQGTFHAGQEMTLTVTLVPGTTPIVVDAYIVVQLPDGTFLSLLPNGSAAPGIVPIATGFTPILFTGPVLSYGFQGHEPLGTYTWFVALVQSGTQAVVAQDVLSMILSP